MTTNNTVAQVTDSILERIAVGDQAAVKQCMDQFGALVWSLARRFSDSPADAEDATQEIFLEIWKSANRYDAAKGSEAVFVATIARRRLIDRVRAKQRRPQTEEFDEARFDTAAGREAEDPRLESEMASAKAAMAALDPGQRQVLLLGIVEGMTHSEIATHTGRPLGTVKTQMRRGLIKVRALLAESAEAPDD